MLKGFGNVLPTGVILLLAGMLLAGCTTVPESEISDTVEWGIEPDEARNAYNRALGFLAGGRQADTEEVVIQACIDYPEVQRLLFLRGVLERSRFHTDQSCGSFAEVYQLNPESMLGRAANIVVSMDVGVGVEEGFRELAGLIEQHPEELLLRWLYVIESVGHRSYAEEAAQQCEQLLDVWKIGPVTLHKAYANLLVVAFDKTEKALEHRWLAAELEPVAKNYEGIARTLELMKRYEDAEPVYAKMVELEPDRAIRWFQWGNCLAYLANYTAAAEKFEKAYVLDKSEVISLLCWGRCLERLGRPQEGFSKYVQALRERPLDQQAAAYVAHAELYGYGTACNFEAALKASANQGRPAIEILRERVRFANKSDNPLAPEHSDILLKHLTALAEGGDAEAQYCLGMIYKNGIGVERDEEASARWIRQAAGNGHAIALRMLNPPL